MKNHRFLAFIARMVGPVVGILSLPMYESLVGSELFKYIVLYFSVQSFALASDFGLTLNSFRRTSLGLSKRSLDYQKSSYYLYLFVILPLAGLIIILGGFDSKIAIDWLILSILSIILGCIGNYQLNMLLAQSLYWEYSINLVSYSALRHLISISLLFISADMFYFVLGQVIGYSYAVYCLKGFREIYFKIVKKIYYIRKLFLSSFVYGLGAFISVAVLTADKFIIGSRLGDEDFSNYYYTYVYGFSVPLIVVSVLLGIYQSDLIRATVTEGNAATKKLIFDSINLNNVVGACLALFLVVTSGFISKLWLGSERSLNDYSLTIMLVFSLFAFSANPFYSLLVGKGYKHYLLMISIFCGSILILFFFYSNADDLVVYYSYGYGLYLFTSYSFILLRVLLGDFETVLKSAALYSYSTTLSITGIMMALLL